jgi:hypothetical protein
VLEDNATQIKLYNEGLKLYGKLVPPKKSKFEQKGVIIDFDYSEEKSLLGAVTSNKRVHFWETRYSKRLIFSQDLKRHIDVIRYINMRDVWVFATHDFFMEVWSVDPLNPKKHLTLIKSIKAHEAMITDFC